MLCICEARAVDFSMPVNCALVSTECGLPLRIPPQAALAPDTGAGGAMVEEVKTAAYLHEELTDWANGPGHQNGERQVH